MHNVGVWIALGLLVYFGPKIYYAFQVGRRKKDRIRFKIRRGTVSLCFYFGACFLMVHLGYTVGETCTFAAVLGIAGALWFVPRPNRTRVIPKRVRKAVIERDLKGVKFDATIHNIDHIVPFSKGGDNSAMNLRVLSRHDNLSRGAKMPALRDFRKRNA